MNVKIKNFSPLMIFMLLSACGKSGVGEVQDWMDTVRKETRVIVPKLNEPKVFVPVPYQGSDQIDPFNPSKLLVILAKLNASQNSLYAPDKDRPKEALEAYPLDTLKMVGTVEKGKVKIALIQVDKAIFQVKAGNYMGQNDGKIIKITDSAIELKEKVQDAAGEWTEKDSSIELQETKK